jgi:hypothetical protein
MYLKHYFFLFAVEILNLLKWREHPEKIQEALNQALCLEGQELVKFLQDILDALFSMFSTEDGNSTMHSGLVFHVLVSSMVALTICFKGVSNHIAMYKIKAAVKHSSF